MLIGCLVLGFGWLVFLFVFALAVLVVFDNYGRSFVLAKKKKKERKKFPCLMCDLCTPRHTRQHAVD